MDSADMGDPFSAAAPKTFMTFSPSLVKKSAIKKSGKRYHISIKCSLFYTFFQEQICAPIIPQ